MDCKPYQSLSKARNEMELVYTSSSDESEDGRNLCKSYTSRETLPDYGQEMRLNYNSHRAKRKTVGEPTGELGFCESTQLTRPVYQTELRSAPLRGYPMGMGSDVETETEGGPSPDHALRLWMEEIKSEHSSCLSSRANSVLSLTDTEQERKSDGENGDEREQRAGFAYRSRTCIIAYQTAALVTHHSGSSSCANRVYLFG
ncbi:hypothetical protein DPEC_G00231670 [Dallia pectoralis]|uniref:Uncharacterized protein n=1 Tax=Dallia pectoralis TaxID=75939 RepID=A0ACC2FX81_DALPE|nr:hypothetical protein DPEC_G00231670 [Dallia pectoralis]